jgi:hypothetical protein
MKTAKQHKRFPLLISLNTINTQFRNELSNKDMAVCMNIHGTYTLPPAHRLELSSLSYTMHDIFLFTFLIGTGKDDFTRTLSLFHSVYVIFGRQLRNQTMSSYLVVMCCTSIFLLTLSLIMNRIKMSLISSNCFS